MSQHTDIDRIAGSASGGLLTVADAARHLSVSQSYLNKARVRGDGPPYAKLGKAIRYRADALERWISNQERISTTEDVSQLH